MKFLPPILRPISHLTPTSPKPHNLQTSTFKSLREIPISNEVLDIIYNVRPMEPALENVAPYLRPNIVITVLQKQRNPELGFRFFVWAAKRKRLRSWVSHNFIVDMLLGHNGFQLYWKTLEDLKSSGISIPSDAFAVLIAGYWKVNMADKAVESFGRMKDFDCKPGLFAYNMMLHVMVQKEVILLALALYNMMLKTNCFLNSSTFSILINGLCKAGKTQDALILFDEMSQRGILPCKITYTVIISGLCHAKRTDDAYRLFNKMKNNRCFPDLITYNALLNGFCKSGKMDEAVELLRSFKEEGYVLGVNGYSCLIDGLLRAKRFNEAHDLFQKLIENKIKPDLVLYTIMIRGYSEESRMKEALNLLREMTRNGILPDTQCYNTLIKGFCDMGLLDQARSLQLEISKNNLFPNTCTYTILICGMCSNGLVGEAQRVFKEMEKVGCFPSVVTFNSLIDGLCKAHELQEAQLMFYKMEIGRNPSIFLRLSQGESIQTMVERMCESGLILKAYKLLMQLADSGVLPNIITYNILINGLCKSGKINGAFKLFKELQLKGISPDSVTYGTLIDGLQRVDRDEDAFGVFEQMVKNGCNPSSSVYKSLMTWSCRKKKISVAFGIWVKYLRTCLGLENEKLDLAEECFEKGEVEKTVKILLQMELKSKLKSIEMAPYTIFLIGLCQAGRLDEALKVFRVLEVYGVDVSPPGCAVLIKSLCKELNLEEAIETFNYALDKCLVLMPKICNILLRSLLRSEEKAKEAFVLIKRMEIAGYDLDEYLHQNTKLHLYYRRGSGKDNLLHH